MKFFFHIILFSLIFGNYSIIQSESNVKYFGNHPIYNFAGSSSSITLLSDCNDSKNICDITFKIPVISLNSGNDSRDSNMLNSLEAFSYSEIILKIENFIIKEYDLEIIPFEVIIHGISQEINIPLTLSKLSKINYKVSSTFSIFLDNFNIELPKLLFIPIDNEIKIQVQILIAKENL